MPQDLRKLLTRRWVHSHEEDTASAMVFRPADYPFPRSRGRTGFNLLADQVVERQSPGPADAGERSLGKWEIDSEGNIEVQTPGRAESTRRVKIVEVSADRLVLEKPGI